MTLITRTTKNRCWRFFYTYQIFMHNIYFIYPELFLVKMIKLSLLKIIRVRKGIYHESS